VFEIEFNANGRMVGKEKKKEKRLIIHTWVKALGALFSMSLTAIIAKKEG